MAAKHFLTFTIKGEDKFSGVLSKLSSKLPSLKTSMLVTSAAIAGTTTALFALSKKTAESIDKVGKFSQRIGISTEAMSKMNYIAGQSGISVDTMGMSLQRMTRRVSEATMGMGSGKASLEELGVSMKAIKNLTPDKQFKMIAEAMEGVSNKSDKVRLAMGIFGMQGAAMLQTMQDGAEGIDKLGEHFEEFGFVITESSAKSAAEFNDAYDDMMQGLGRFMKEFAVELMPFFTKSMKQITKFLSDNKSEFKAWADTAVEGLKIVKTGAIATYNAVKTLSLAFKGAQIARLQYQIDAKDKLIDLIVKKVETSANTIAYFRKRGAELSETEKAMLVASKKTAQLLVKYTGERDALSLKLKEIREDIAAGDQPKRFKIDLGAGGKIPAPEFGIPKPPDISSFGKLGEGVEGFGFFSTGRLEGMAENIVLAEDMQNEALTRLNERYAEYLFTDEERLERWKKDELKKVVKNKDAIVKVDAIYAKKKKALDEKTKAEKDRDDKITRDKRIGALQDMHGHLHAIAVNAGERGAKMAKALAIFQAVANTRSAAIGAYNALSSIPFIGPALGIAAAAAATAYGMDQIASIKGNTLSGWAHNGLGYVPREGTYMLDKGEKVLSPRQNTELTAFLETQKSNQKYAFDRMSNYRNQGETIINIEVLPNATNAEAMLSMTRDDWEDIVTEQILPAFTILKEQGATI